jgi:hypothetical protein
MPNRLLDDRQIRDAYHGKRLHRHHASSVSVVVDELGLQHGRFRADIAVINGHLAGFEIKSDYDRLHRLGSQLEGYCAVFDLVTLILTPKHLEGALSIVPNWWGIVISSQGPRGGIRFRTHRPGKRNPDVNDLCVAQLLWRKEVTEILVDLGIEDSALRGNRQALYAQLITRLGSSELREHVRQRMKSRQDWRCPSRLSQGVGLCLPNAT